MNQIERIAEDTEHVLADDYPVYTGYAYIADGKQVESPGCGTVAELKEMLGAKEIRKCDISKRGLYDRYGFKVVDNDS